MLLLFVREFKKDIAGGNCAFLWEFPDGKQEPSVDIVVKDVFAAAPKYFPNAKDSLPK